jgi:signal transduction histidine kinase/ActR/RegA family two-component response regulator
VTAAADDAAILVVDDRPDQRPSLAALLSELGVEVVEARSGRDALRWLLRREFAVILLDVHMPGMDGFETAELIRQRKSCEHTPIIFVTAYADDAYAARSYSLGAVDHILAPVDPQALKSKVSVFLDLYRKSAELRRHAASRERHAEQLRRLADAALAIHGAGSLDELLKRLADAATSIICAQQVAVALDALSLGAPLEPARRARYAVARPERTPLVLLAGRALADAPARPVRMTRAELEGHPDWAAPSDDGPPLRGWLAAPLSDRQGRPIGWIQLSDKQGGDFTDEDETLLVQLAQMAAIAAENTLFDEAQEANRIKDQFLGTLSHELRTPLQSILSWARLLREMPPDEAHLRRGLEVIERNARLQTRLIDDLLDVSRILSGKLLLEQRLLRVADLVQAALDDAQPAARDKGVRVAIEHVDEAQIAGDANRLRQVLGNLLSNALKFTPAGGAVVLRADADATHVELCVRDTGKGIAQSFQPHLFERFRQADGGTTRGKGGLGIGLAIARHLVELHGGTIRAHSDGEGLGASFFVRFPLAHAVGPRVPAPAPPPCAQPEPPRLGGLRILLVEDDDDTRECLALGLRRHGAEVVAVASASLAEAALERDRFDVLLSDLAMPGEDGFSLVRRVRARAPGQGGHLPAAALSAHARAEERARALLAGFDLHLAKPIEPDELAGVVRELVARRDA